MKKAMDHSIPIQIKDEEENQNSRSVIPIDTSSSQTPIELIFDILSRLPVKSLLQFRCVSKLWCTLIHDPLFVHNHLSRSIVATRPDSFRLFISAYSKSTIERYFFSASHHGGAATHLLTLPNSPSDPTESEHLNGLLLFRRQNGFVRHNFAYIFNPSTREIVKLPGKASIPRYSYGNAHVSYMFGFDQFTNEYKILNIRMIRLRSAKPTIIECGIFSLNTYSWRKIDPVFPFDIMGQDWFFGLKDSVCVNNVIHLILDHRNIILAFDLREEKFSIMQLPSAAIPSEFTSSYGVDPITLKLNHPYLMKISGCLAVICHDRVVDHNAMDIWILEDYQNQTWVKDSIMFPGSWVDLDSPFPCDAIPTGEIILTLTRVSRDVVKIPFYDMKQKSFRFVEISLLPELLNSDELGVGAIRSYVESIFPLRRSG